MPIVPDNELEISSARASGPGGQNVNKVNSKAILHWNVGESAAFSEEQKDKIRSELASLLSKEDKIVLSEQRSRSWFENRDAIIERLQEKVAAALAPQKKRLPTKMPRSSKEQRLKDKHEQSSKKQLRRPPEED